MFNWGSKSKSSKPSPSNKPKSSSLAFPSFDDEPVEFKEEDLNDPELLRELGELMEEAPKKRVEPVKASVKTVASVLEKPLPVSKPVVSLPEPEDDPLTLPQDLHLPSSFDQDVEIDFDENDERDPELLAELARVGGVDVDDLISGMDGMSLTKPTPSQVEEPVVVKQENVKHPSQKEQVIPPLQQLDQDALPLSYKLLSSDPKTLEKYIELEKVKAVTKKRSGDLVGAKEGLKGVKQLEQRLIEVMEKKAPVKEAVKAVEQIVVKPVEEQRVEEKTVKEKPVEEIVSKPVEIVEPVHVEEQLPVGAPKEDAMVIDEVEKVVEEPHIYSETPVKRKADEMETPLQEPLIPVTSVSPLPEKSEVKPIVESIIIEPSPVSEPIQAPFKQTPVDVVQPTVQQVDIDTPPSPVTLSPSDQALLTLLSTRIQQFKTSALQYKRTNDIPKARDSLMKSKNLEAVRESLESGLGVPEGFVVPEQPENLSGPAPNQAASPAPKTSTPKPSKPLGITNQGDDLTSYSPSQKPKKPDAKQTQLFSHLMDTLKEQIELCTSISAHYFRAGDKQSALKWHKMKKQFITDVETLKATLATLESGGQAPLPIPVKKDVQYELERQFTQLLPTEMEVGVIKGLGLMWENQPADANVSWDLNWPLDSEGNTKSEGKGETPTIYKSVDPEWKYGKRIACVDRSSRAFHRFLEKKRANFEIWHYRGWLRGRILIGRAYLKLEGLLTSCEVHDVLEVMDPNNPRKSTGAKLEVRVRMRMPASKNEVLKVSESWMFVEWGILDSQATVSPQPAKASPQPVKTPSLQAPSPQPATPGKPLAVPQDEPLSSPKSPSPSRSASPDDDLQDLIMAFQSPSSIVSNMVIEYEISNLEQLIPTLKGDAKEDKTQELAALKIREMELVLAVQNGSLTPQAYLGQLKKSILETKQMALKFKNKQRLMEAKKCLERIKIMEKEASEVEEMIANE